MFKATLSRILVFAKPNPFHLAPSQCEKIGDDMLSTLLLCKAGKRSQEDKVYLLQLLHINMYQNKSIVRFLLSKIQF
jgi:hypothetical protein